MLNLKNSNSVCKKCFCCSSNFERRGNPAQVLLDAWMTDAPTFEEVINVLVEAKLIRPANIILEKVLQGKLIILKKPSSQSSFHFLL